MKLAGCAWKENPWSPNFETLLCLIENSLSNDLYLDICFYDILRSKCSKYTNEQFSLFPFYHVCTKHSLLSVIKVEYTC